MKRLISALILAVLVFGLSCTYAYADKSYDKSYDFEAVFDGSKISQPGGGTIGNAAKDMQPGDTITLNFALKDKADRDTDWYMSSRLIETLEDDAKKPGGGAYAYSIVYKAPDTKETVIFDSKAAGGEKGSLKEMTESLSKGDKERYIYLGNIGKGSEGKVTLKMTLNGETEGNDYMNTAAKLGMKFAIEDSNQYKYYAPKTADRTGVFVWGGIFTVCLACAFYLAVLIRRERKS